jgi:hypothetical protein
MASLARIRSILEIAVHIGQTEFQEFPERFALERTAENVVAPLLGVVYVAIIGCDIEVAKHHELFINFEFVLEKISQSSEPAKLVLILLRADALTVGHVQVDDAYIVDRRNQYAALRIFEARKIENVVCR